jgi:hypothetical protein
MIQTFSSSWAPSLVRSRIHHYSRHSRRPVSPTFGGITSLTDQAIDRLKHWDDSSGKPVNEELGHGYQQLIRFFNAFLLTKNDEGKRIHEDWQNLTMTAEFQEF